MAASTTAKMTRRVTKDAGTFTRYTALVIDEVDEGIDEVMARYRVTQSRSQWTPTTPKISTKFSSPVQVPAYDMHDDRSGTYSTGKRLMSRTMPLLAPTRLKKSMVIDVDRY